MTFGLKNKNNNITEFFLKGIILHGINLLFFRNYLSFIFDFLP